jgi:hypothetical protein
VLILPLKRLQWSAQAAMRAQQLGRSRETSPGTCEPVHRPVAGPVLTFRSKPPERDMNYDGFQIEAFEAGRGLWHARIRRADCEPVIIDGVSFPELEVGFAWSNRDGAISDAKTRIDYLNQRSVIVEHKRQASHV